MPVSQSIHLILTQEQYQLSVMLLNSQPKPDAPDIANHAGSQTTHSPSLQMADTAYSPLLFFSNHEITLNFKHNCLIVIVEQQII